MIFRQQLFRISNTVSVQSKFFAIAHDDFAEAQLLHVSAVIVLTVGAKKVG